MSAKDWDSQGLKRHCEWRIVTDRHRAHRIAVIGVFESDDVALFRPSAILPVLDGQL